MEISIWTIQMAQWRSIKLLHPDIELVNITQQSGIKEFAPDWDFLMRYKASGKTIQDEEEYLVAYRQKINKMWHERRELFTKLFMHKKLALMCYCPTGTFCHRHHFARALVAAGKMSGHVVINHGEFVV